MNFGSTLPNERSYIFEARKNGICFSPKVSPNIIFFTKKTEFYHLRNIESLFIKIFLNYVNIIQCNLK